MVLDDKGRIIVSESHTYRYGKSGTPVKPASKVGPITVEGAPPILLVGGTNDPATPYASAQAVNKVLARSVLLTREGNGHVSYGSSACAKQAIDAYLIDLKLPALGTVCR